MPDFKRLPSYDTENLIQPLMRALDAVVDPALDDVDEIIVDHDGEVLRSPLSLLKSTFKSYFDTLYVDLTNNQTVAGVKRFTSSTMIGVDAAPDYTLELSGATAPKLAMSDTGLAHGITDFAQTDVFFLVEQVTDNDGGARIWGFSDAVGVTPLRLVGAFGSDNPTDTVPAIWLLAAKRTGTTLASLASSETLLAISNNGTDRFTIMGDGNTGFGGVPATKVHAFGTQGTNTIQTEEVFRLTRPLNSGVSYNEDFVVAIGRYELDAVSAQSRTRVDFRLNNASGEAPSAVMTLQGNGKVSIGRLPSPYGLLAVEGGVHFRSSYIMDRATGEATNGYFYQSVRESGDISNFGNPLGNGVIDMGSVALTGIIIGTYSNNGTTYANAAIAHVVGQGVNGNLLGSGTHILQEFFLNDGTRRYFNPGGRPANYRGFFRVIVRDSAGLQANASTIVVRGGAEINMPTDGSNSVDIGIDASGFAYVERSTGTRSWVIFGEVMYY